MHSGDFGFADSILTPSIHSFIHPQTILDPSVQQYINLEGKCSKFVYKPITNGTNDFLLVLQRWNHLEFHVVKDGKGQNDGLCP